MFPPYNPTLVMKQETADAGRAGPGEDDRPAPEAADRRRDAGARRARRPRQEGAGRGRQGVPAGDRADRSKRPAPPPLGRRGGRPSRSQPRSETSRRAHRRPDLEAADIGNTSRQAWRRSTSPGCAVSRTPTRSGSRCAAAITLIALTPARRAAGRGGDLRRRPVRPVRRLGLYHRWRWHPRWRPILRRIDHSTIYVFIAACYTPVGCSSLVGRDALGRADHRLGRRAARRRLQRRLDHRAARGLRGDLHRARLGRGARFPQLSAALPLTPLILIAAAASSTRSARSIFALGRPNPWPRVFGFHEIFHVFVILAAVAHFVAMAGWIVPSGHDA